LNVEDFDVPLKMRPKFHTIRYEQKFLIPVNFISFKPHCMVDDIFQNLDWMNSCSFNLGFPQGSEFGIPDSRQVLADPIHSSVVPPPPPPSYPPQDIAPPVILPRSTKTTGNGNSNKVRKGDGPESRLNAPDPWDNYRFEDHSPAFKRLRELVNINVKATEIMILSTAIENRLIREDRNLTTRNRAARKRKAPAFHWLDENWAVIGPIFDQAVQTVLGSRLSFHRVGLNLITDAHQIASLR
jgi:hypothetical protein